MSSNIDMFDRQAQTANSVNMENTSLHIMYMLTDTVLYEAHDLVHVSKHCGLCPSRIFSISILVHITILFHIIIPVCHDS